MMMCVKRSPEILLNRIEHFKRQLVPLLPLPVLSLLPREQPIQVAPLSPIQTFVAPLLQIVPPPDYLKALTHLNYLLVV